jgi:hypothetical protein
MPQHIFQSSNELQNIIEAAPSSRSFSVSEKLALYGSSALSGVEHLRLVVGKDSVAAALLGATQGTLRYDPISRLRPPDNFRFQYWPWQFPDKIDCPAAFFNALQAEIFRFCPFWEIAWE